jgi:hypothetical protein
MNYAPGLRYDVAFELEQSVLSQPKGCKVAVVRPALHVFAGVSVPALADSVAAMLTIA